VPWFAVDGVERVWLGIQNPSMGELFEKHKPKIATSKCFLFWTVHPALSIEKVQVVELKPSCGFLDAFRALPR